MLQSLICTHRASTSTPTPTYSHARARRGISHLWVQWTNDQTPNLYLVQTPLSALQRSPHPSAAERQRSRETKKGGGGRGGPAQQDYTRICSRTVCAHMRTHTHVHTCTKARKESTCTHAKSHAIKQRHPYAIIHMRMQTPLCTCALQTCIHAHNTERTSSSF